jgi:hypothetical protein
MFNNGLPDSSLFCCILLLCLPHCLPAHMTCVVCSSAFYTLCTMSLQCNLPLLCISTPALCLLAHTSILLHSNHNNSISNNNPISSLLPCTYSLCAPRACNVHNPSACSHRADILHLSSALPDHHGNSSASLAVFPRVQHHWVLC